MPDPYQEADGSMSWDKRFPAYGQLNAQLTRRARRVISGPCRGACRVSGGPPRWHHRQKNPIIDAEHPWSTTFDPTMVWGPVHGRMFYAGIRINIGEKM